jgi:hypothetical protein
VEGVGLGGRGISGFFSEGWVVSFVLRLWWKRHQTQIVIAMIRAAPEPTLTNTISTSDSGNVELVVPLTDIVSHVRYRSFI